MPSTSAPADGRGSGRGRSLTGEGITKVFSTRGEPVVALDGIDLTVRSGEFVSILGPSGCGKSTLLAILAGLESATSGSVTIDGEAVTEPVLSAGFMFQRDLLLDWRTCENNVLLQFEMRGQKADAHRDRGRELLELVGVAQFAHRLPRELSGGMRQRVAICRALVHNPPILFMDEPFGALDAITRENLNLELGRLTSRAGTTVLFVTHSITEAAFLGDRVVVMSPRPGRIVADLRIDLPRPREPEMLEGPDFTGYCGQLRRLLADEGALGSQAHV